MGPDDDTASHGRSLRVMTMYVWARHGHWAARRAVLADGLGALQPDLMALQETVVTEGYDQVRELLGEGWSVVHQQRRESDGTGMSLASRWPVTASYEMDLLVTDRVDPREFVGALLVATVQAPEPVGPVLFASPKPSFRLGLEHKRELQAVAADGRLEDLAARHGGHVVLAGDFDATPDSASMRFWRVLQSLGGTSVAYRDAWESTHPGQSGHTFSPANPLVAEGTWPLELGRRIDYVMVRCDDHGPTLRVVSCARLFDEAGGPDHATSASDHFGVLAELDLHR